MQSWLFAFPFSLRQETIITSRVSRCRKCLNVWTDHRFFPTREFHHYAHIPPRSIPQSNQILYHPPSYETRDRPMVRGEQTHSQCQVHQVVFQVWWAAKILMHLPHLQSDRPQRRVEQILPGLLQRSRGWRPWGMLETAGQKSRRWDMIVGRWVKVGARS